MVESEKQINQSKKDEKSKFINEIKEFTTKRKSDQRLRFDYRQYYYSVVNAEIGEGYKPIKREFLSSWPDEQSALSTVKCPMPLGIAVDNQYDFEGRKPGFFDVIRVEPGSNAEKADVQVGDTLRACNSVMDKKVI